MPLNSEIAALMVEAGRARASGHAGAAEAWAHALSQIGNTVGSTIADIPNQQEIAKQRADVQRGRDARNAYANLMKNTPLVDIGDGAKGLDIPALVQGMTDAGHGDSVMATIPHMESFNQAANNFQQSRMGLLRSSAMSLSQTGSDPDLTVALLHKFKDMQVYGPETIDQWIAKIQDNPSAAKAVTAFLAGPQKSEIIPYGAKAVNPATNEVTVENPREKPQPTEASLAAAAAGGDTAAADALSRLQPKAREPLPTESSLALAAAKGDQAAAKALELMQRNAGSSGPLVAIMKRQADGTMKPILVPRREAIGQTPATTREQGRQLPAGQATAIGDFDTALDNLAVLKSVVGESSATGVGAQIGAAVPAWVTDLTGWGIDAKKKQGLIDRVKQVIGKTLEGGVLRKEDEIKYEKILPTIKDTTEVVKSKLAGLESAITKQRGRELDSLEDANYDVTAFRNRKPPISESWERGKDGKLHKVGG